MKVWYMGLEKLEERYSFQLEEWNRREFERLDVPFEVVRGTQIESAINVGSVLDAYGRTTYSLTQIAQLIQHIRQGDVGRHDVIFFEDMYTPGIESLPYIFDQLGWYPRVFVRCLAQTIDPDDFVHRTGMFDWMRPFERVVDALCLKSGGGILAASEEMVPYLKVAEFKAPIFVTGLPFGKDEVLERATPQPWESRSRTVSYAARWDSEKQPGFFLEVAALVRTYAPSIQFQILTGSKALRSDNPAMVEAVQQAKNVKVYAGLTKNQYYSMLASSKVLFNCALQDWVSNTVSEADALGCMTIFPAYRSFPEVFANNADHMYVPWSAKDAATKICDLILDAQTTPPSVGSVSSYQDRSIERTIRVFQGHDEGRRDSIDYRKHTAIPKY